jgi:hypothetical protein
MHLIFFLADLFILSVRQIRSLAEVTTKLLVNTNKDIWHKYL